MAQIVKADVRQSPLICGVEVGLDVLRLEDLHLEFLHLRCDAVLGGVAEDQAFFYGAVQGIVEHQVQAADGGTAESGVAVTAVTSGTTALHQLLVELLQVVGGQLGELDAADTGGWRTARSSGGSDLLLRCGYSVLRRSHTSNVAKLLPCTHPHG